jgi:hypothetical protein
MVKLVLGVAALALSAGAASAQVGYPGYDYGYAAPIADLAPPAYGYAPPAPIYNYAAPAYAAPATGGTTIIIVTPGPAYSASVGSGYYNYAPGYWGATGAPGIGAATDTAGARESRQTRLFGLGFLLNAHVVA